jgi:murein DD-endopeptidase MepM/ murein hydrolase activator NlpD
MSVNKYIIILICFIFALNCAPPKNIRQRNNIVKYKSSSSDDSFYKWPANEHENNYEDLSSSDDEENSYDNEYNEKPQIKSRISIISESKIRDNNLDRIQERKKNHYPDKIQNKTNSLSQNRKTNLKDSKLIKSQNYKVEKGDNLLKISKKFNVPISEITSINKISKDEKIYKGMILKIPVIKITNKTNIEYASHDDKQKKPNFTWPIKNVYNTKRDGLDGVKSIGIIITGEQSTAVFPSADGVVTKVGTMRGFGNYVILKHLNQYLTIYSNLKDINVNEGEKVRCGKIIGRLDGNKLHFQIDYSGKPQDPYIFLSRKS